MSSPKRIPSKLNIKLLVEANHGCTICGRSGVQIHHIDGNPANNEEGNLIVLCLLHHDEAERSKFSKALPTNLSPTALYEYKHRLKLGFQHAKIEQQRPQTNISANLQDVDRSIVIISDDKVSLTLPQSTSFHEERSTQDTSADWQTGLVNRPTIGIVTALAKEYAAVNVLLEDPVEFNVVGKGAGRRYLVGEIPTLIGGKHSVVLSLAAMGNNIAAARATLLLEHFPNVKSIIMVGIAGGVPYPEKPDEHVRLGDIVISDGRGVVQYDFDKETISEVKHRNPPRPPSATLLEAVNLLEVEELKGNYLWLKYIDLAKSILRVNRPAKETDILADSNDPNGTTPHPEDPRRIPDQPMIFSGTIASANKLLKNPIKRDALRDQFSVKAVEMEGSGIADATWNYGTGYLIVRGICDYCDANKGDVWQEYAAIVAAAYARALLESIPSTSDKRTKYVKSESGIGKESGEDADYGFLGNPIVINKSFRTKEKDELWTNQQKE